MFLAKKILSALILPPAGPLILAALGLLLVRRHPRLGRALAWAGLLCLYLLSVPAVTSPLLASLQSAPVLAPARLREAQAILVLGGGRYRNAPEYRGDTASGLTLERVRYGARLARASGLPLMVAAGAPHGGRPEADIMADMLKQEYGVAVRWAESASRDTRENARFSAPLLRNAGVSRVVLVTHAWHMRRALAEFEAAGLQVIPGPTGFVGTGSLGAVDFFPSQRGFVQGYYATREWLGILAQRLTRLIR